MLTPQLELVHFQITKNCNLRCWFCGQWGKRGFFSDDKGVEVSLDKWLEIINELKVYGQEVGRLPDVMLWGGEPLVSPYFSKLVTVLHNNGFKVGVVTNGVFIDRFCEIINENVSVLYVSIDGTKDVHDAIRGSGVFDKVVKNLNYVDKNKVDVRIMSVVTEQFIYNFDEFIQNVAEISPQKLILQEFIYLSVDEAEDYKKWLKTAFNQNADSIFTWVGNFVNLREKTLNLLKNKYPVDIEFIPHNNVGDRGCYSPFKHAHVAWNGNVLFCTDFYDFSAGNVNDNKLLDIFYGETADKFREQSFKNKCATCKHCSWKNSENFYL